MLLILGEISKYHNIDTPQAHHIPHPPPCPTHPTHPIPPTPPARGGVGGVGWGMRLLRVYTCYSMYMYIYIYIYMYAYGYNKFFAWLCCSPSRRAEFRSLDFESKGIRFIGEAGGRLNGRSGGRSPPARCRVGHVG